MVRHFDWKFDVMCLVVAMRMEIGYNGGDNYEG